MKRQKSIDFNNFRTNDSEELIVRGFYKQLLIYAILLTAFCLGVIIEIVYKFNNSSQYDILTTIIIVGIFLFLVVVFWLKLFDRRIKIVINKIGILSNETGVIEWNEIWYFYIKEYFFKGRNYHYLLIKTKTEIEYKVELTNFDKSYELVRKAIFVNSKK